MIDLDKAIETRTLVYNRAGGHCEVCGKLLGFLEYQMAHRIPQRQWLIRKYGEEVIHHYLNMAATCGLICNNKVSIGNHPVEIDKLVQEIKETIQNG